MDKELISDLINFIEQAKLAADNTMENDAAMAWISAESERLLEILKKLEG